MALSSREKLTFPLPTGYRGSKFRVQRFRAAFEYPYSGYFFPLRSKFPDKTASQNSLGSKKKSLIRRSMN